MSDEWAWVKKLGFDDEGYERRERCEAIVECLKCHKEVELVSDTECWTKERDGKWHHSEYGPAQGCCCGLLMVHSFNGLDCYKLEATP